MDIRVSQSRRHDASLQDFLSQAEADVERALPAAFQSPSPYVVRKYTKAAGYARIRQSFILDFRRAIWRFLGTFLKTALTTVEESRRERITDEDTERALHSCARASV